MIRAFLLLLLFSIGFSLFGQQTARERYVYTLFEKPGKVKWVKHFKGRIDDINDIAVTLAYDGKNCRGQMVYLRSREQFRLEGTLKNDYLKLQEIDHEEAVSGYLVGQFAEEQILASWSNHNYSIGGDVRLKKLTNDADFPSHCGDNKWMTRYKGKLVNEELELVLLKDSEFELRGVAFFKKENASYIVKGEIDERQNINLKVIDEHDLPKGTIQGTIKASDGFRAAFINANDKKVFTNFKKQESYSIGCMAFADYLSSYDIIYPKTKSQKFNEWIENVSREWVNNCQEYSNDVRKSNNSLAPPLRAALRANAWYDAGFASDKIFSGMLIFSNTWTVGMKGKNVNFDLEKGEEIKFENVFKKDFDHNKYVKNYMNSLTHQYEKYNNFKYRKWLSRQDFPYFNISPEGIVFSTEYSMIFGRQQVTIPYADLKAFLKKKSPVWSLVK